MFIVCVTQHLCNNSQIQWDSFIMRMDVMRWWYSQKMVISQWSLRTFMCVYNKHTTWIYWACFVQSVLSHPRQSTPSTLMGPEIPQYPHIISHLPGLTSPSSFTGRLLTTVLLNKDHFVYTNNSYAKVCQSCQTHNPWSSFLQLPGSLGSRLGGNTDAHRLHWRDTHSYIKFRNTWFN